MLDSRMLLVGGTIRLTVPTYVDDVATTPSGITVTAYKNGIATGDSITPTLDHYGTGLSLVSYTPSGLAAGDTVTLKISATVSGTTRVTVAEFSVMSTAAAIAALVAAGTVAGVSGDVTGKVLGGGSGTISGVGSRVVDGDGEAVAKASAVAALGSGNGPNQVNVTVGSSAGGTVQGAVVRMQAAGLGDHTATTNSSGVAQFNLPSGTWNLTAALNGYSYAGSTQVISTNPQIIPITMVINTVSAPSSPDMTVGVMLCLNSSDEPEENVVVYFRKIAGSGVDGYSHDSAVVKILSNEFGIIEREFQKGSQYGVRRGSLTAVEEIFTAPSTQQFLILETIGKP